MTNVLEIAFDDLFQYKDFMQSGRWGTAPFGVNIPLPNFARLEARSTVFRRGAATIPVCNPSRASIMTGYSPYLTGVFNAEELEERIQPEQVWFYKLKQANYYIGTVGKMFHGYTPVNPKWYTAIYDNDPFVVRWNPAGEATDWGGMYGGGFDGDEDRYYDSMVAEYTENFLAGDALTAAAQGRSWHWQAGFHHPHNPWVAPNRIFEAFPDLSELIIPTEWPLAWELLPFARDYVGMGQQIGTPSPSTWDPEFIIWWKESVRNYMVAVQWADECLGRVLDALEASPFNDDTIIVCWSDHGYHMGDKDRWHKFTLWEEACNAPFMISLPGQTVSRTIWDPVSLIDTGPTVLDYLNISPASDLQGVSILPYCEGGTMDRGMVPSFNFGSASGAIGPMRITVYADGSYEYYDTMEDPSQKNNLALTLPPTDPTFAEHKEMLNLTAKEWGLDLVSEGAILKPGTPFASYLGWEPNINSPVSSLFVIGDAVPENAHSPGYKQMYVDAVNGLPEVPGSVAARIKVPAGMRTLVVLGSIGGSKVVEANDMPNNIVIPSGTNRTVYAGDGDDTISGSVDDPEAVGGGRIIVYGGRGNDIIMGSDGANWELPHDSLYGGAGDDSLRGFAGNDYLEGGAGNDTIIGDSGNDTILADAGSDSINAGAGLDVIIVTGGSHTITGGADADTFVFKRTGQLQTITDFTSADTLDLADFAPIQPVTLTQTGSDVLLTSMAERILLKNTTVAVVGPRIIGATYV